MEPDEFARCITYRRAYGIAHRALERDTLGPNFPGRDARTLLARLTAHVVAEMGTDHGFSEAVQEGVQDALEGRRPRW